MAVTGISRDFAEAPQIVRMVAENTLAEVGATGYLTAQAATIEALNSGEWVWQPSDMVLVYASNGLGFYSVSADLASLDAVVFTIGATTPTVIGDVAIFDSVGGNIGDSGASLSDATKTKVVMAGSAVVVNHIAKFIDTFGTVDDTAGAAINSGNIQAGLSGTAGTLISFPATAANGSLILAAANAGGAFNTTISNGVMAQSTVYTLGDIGAAAGGVVVATSAIRMKVVSAAAAAGGAAAQSFTDAFCTAASVVTGHWVTQTTAGQIVKIVPANGSFVVTSTVDIGVGTFSYVIHK